MNKEVIRLIDEFPQGKPESLPIGDPRFSEGLIKIAEGTQRKRCLILLHDSDREIVHRMINTMLPETYAAPHKHPNKVQTEAYDPIYGEAATVMFNDDGDVTRILKMGGKHGRIRVEVPPNTWHTVVALAPFVMSEVKGQGENYIPRFDKKFAPFAPLETGTFVDGLSSKILREIVENPEKRKEGKEKLRKLAIGAAIADGLKRAYLNHKALGEAGKERVGDSTNQFKDQPLRGDLKAESQVLSGLRAWAKASGSFIKVKSEELGYTESGKVQGKHYLAVLDGLDGTGNYKTPGEFSYGTMVAVAESETPTYEDFVASGIMLPEESWIILAIKGVGVFVHELDSDKTVKLPKFGDEDFNDKRILADNYFKEAKALLGDKQESWPRTGSTAASIAAIATNGVLPNWKYPRMNLAWQGLVDVTRKGNLEQPVVYRIIRELGGLMITDKGEDVGDKSFLTWGQSEKLPIIIARNKKILDAINDELLFSFLRSLVDKRNLGS